MARLQTLSEGDLHPDTRLALEPVRVGGRVADVYLEFANSEPALIAYLGMEAALKNGQLSTREIEGIKLLVSEFTGCAYCLSVHTLKASHAGLSPEVQQAIRSGVATGDARLDALLRVASRLYHKPGPLPEALVEEARGAGLSDAQLVDLVMAMSTIWYTNLVNHINDTRSSLPPAPPLQPASSTTPPVGAQP